MNDDEVEVAYARLQGILREAGWDWILPQVASLEAELPASAPMDVRSRLKRRLEAVQRAARDSLAIEAGLFTDLEGVTAVAFKPDRADGPVQGRLIQRELQQDRAPIALRLQRTVSELRRLIDERG